MHAAVPAIHQDCQYLAGVGFIQDDGHQITPFAFK